VYHGLHLSLPGAGPCCTSAASESDSDISDSWHRYVKFSALAKARVLNRSGMNPHRHKSLQRLIHRDDPHVCTRYHPFQGT
jgi:hypothetical protein